jgi:hypothetical protein
MSNRRKLRRARPAAWAGWRQIGTTTPEPDAFRPAPPAPPRPNVVYGPGELFMARPGGQWQRIG